MTIKQQGGIFGRNPKFNDVTVDGTLTTSGDVAFNTDTLYVDTANDRVGVRTATPDSAFEVVGEATIGSGTYGVKLTYSGGNQSGIIDTADSANNLEFRVQNSKKLVINSSGNLVVNSGSGIDFSATSGTGTSELFNDYEEGTWTPVIIGGTTAGTGTYSQQDGVYTKVGNLVTVSCYLAFTAHTGTGHMKISGLPFAGVGSSVDFQAGATQAQYVNAGTGATQLCASVVTTASDISLYGFVNNAVKVATQVNASGSGSQLAITLTYRTT